MCSIGSNNKNLTVNFILLNGSTWKESIPMLNSLNPRKNNQCFSLSILLKFLALYVRWSFGTERYQHFFTTRQLCITQENHHAYYFSYWIVQCSTKTEPTDLNLKKLMSFIIKYKNMLNPQTPPNNLLCIKGIYTKIS